MSLAQHINVATVDTLSILRDDSYQYNILKLHVFMRILRRKCLHYENKTLLWSADVLDTNKLTWENNNTMHATNFGQLYWI